MSSKKKLKKQVNVLCKAIAELQNELESNEEMSETILHFTMAKGTLFIKFMSETLNTPTEDLIGDFEEWAMENGFAEMLDDTEDPQEALGIDAGLGLLWTMDEVLSELEPPESE